MCLTEGGRLTAGRASLGSLAARARAALGLAPVGAAQTLGKRAPPSAAAPNVVKHIPAARHYLRWKGWGEDGTVRLVEARFVLRQRWRSQHEQTFL